MLFGERFQSRRPGFEIGDIAAIGDYTAQEMFQSRRPGFEIGDSPVDVDIADAIY